MRVGCCISTLDQLEVLEQTGADFCELQVTRLARLEASEFAALAARLAGSSAPARRANVLLPSDLAVVGPMVDVDRLHEYLQLALDRLSGLGVEVAVFGSGASRRVPDGFDGGRALDQLAEFVRRLAAAAAERRITVAVEHLRREETNLLNTLADAADFIRGRGLVGVALLADVYHLYEERESLDVLADCAGLVAHVHLADSGRRPPGQGDWDLLAFLAELNRGGYRGDVSIECAWTDFAAEAPAAVAQVRVLVGQLAGAET
jgi:sugar phosphate isomerase/epimerase